jgi:hypothetical protein
MRMLNHLSSCAFHHLRLPSILITPLIFSITSVSPAFSSHLLCFPSPPTLQHSHHTSYPFLDLSVSPAFTSSLLSFPSPPPPQHSHSSVSPAFSHPSYPFRHFRLPSLLVSLLVLPLTSLLLSPVILSLTSVCPAFLSRLLPPPPQLTHHTSCPFPHLRLPRFLITPLIISLTPSSPGFTSFFTSSRAYLSRPPLFSSSPTPQHSHHPSYPN